MEYEEKSEVSFDEEERKRKFFRGIIWGAFAAVIVLIAAVIVTMNNVDLLITLSLWLAVYGIFAMVSQFFWESSDFLLEMLLFFCKSFAMPGIIFTFSLDGFMFLIAMKALFAIISVVLSVLWFLFGLVIMMLVSMLTFPFTFIREMTV